jgi:hypothetical protein
MQQPDKYWWLDINRLPVILKILTILSVPVGLLTVDIIYSMPQVFNNYQWYIRYPLIASSIWLIITTIVVQIHQYLIKNF